MITRIACALTAATVAASLLMGRGAAYAASDYPSRPVHLIAQQPPGSQSEAISRIWATCASRELGQPVLVMSKPGANGVIATNFLKAQPADGYNVMTIGMSQLTITPYVYRNPPYDPVKDFDNVAVLSTSPLILVASVYSGIWQFPAIAIAARKTVGGVNYGSPGKGSPAHLLTAAVLKGLNVEGTHVPFVGEAAGVTALLSGQIDIMTLTSGIAGSLIKDRRVVPLAIYATSRDPAFAEVPSIFEMTGSNELALAGWLALVVKAGTPSTVINRLAEATSRCVSSDRRYRLRLAQVHATPIESSPADVTLWTSRYSSVFKRIITTLGLSE